MTQDRPLTDVARLLRLDGRVALVTGAGAGIGRATALAMAAAGARVLVTDADETAAVAVAGEIGGEIGGAAEAHRLDVADEAGTVALFDRIGRAPGRLDILVNNAGRGARQPSEELATEAWDGVVAVNLTGAFRCAREAGRLMLPAGRGAVVNVASIMGLVGGGLYPNLSYHATKGALVNLTRALAVEWAGRGVRVNAVAPTFVRTRLTERLLGDPEMARRILALTPLGRLAEPEEVAAAILFLASDAAAMITGVTLPVDGGWTAQ